MLFQNDGVTVVHAINEGDVDVIIVQKALTLAASVINIKDMSDNTNILVLLLYLATEGSWIIMKTKSAELDVLELQKVLENRLKTCLPFIHAVAGCDTMSLFYGLGKLKPLQLIDKNPHQQNEISIIGYNSATHQLV